MTRTIGVITGLAVFAGLLAAQTDRANITGVVTDQSGAVVANASVRAVHIATNSERSTRTGSQGDYTLAQLPLGDYRVEFSAAGFKALNHGNVNLTAGSTTRLDAALQLGQMTEKVEVSAQAAQLQTESARVMTAVTPKFVEDLPLVVGGQLRSPLDLVLIAPETKNTYNISVGGGQEGGWDLSVDGISATPAAPFEQRLWTMINSPSVDAVQEFAVDTNGFKAEFGHAGGGAFSFVSKSGTNSVHGSAYEFLRNQAFDANNFFNNQQGRKKPILKQHDFGVTVGGPVWIPKLYRGKDKTFFFLSYEGFRNRTGPPVNFRTVPTPEMYQGDFTNWKDAKGLLIPVYDPSTTRSDGKGGFERDPFPGNKFSATRFSSVAKNLIPLATMRPNTADPSGILAVNPRNNFVTTTGAATYPWDKFSAKGDHQLTQNNRLGFLFQKNRTQQLAIGTPPGLPVPINNDFQFGDTWTKVYRLTHDWSATPTVLSHLSLGINDWGQVRRATNEQFQQGWGTKLGIKNVPDPDLLMPAFNFDGYSTWGRAEYGGSYNKTWAGTEDLTVIRGKHSLKFGGQYQEDHYNGYGMHSATGNFSFARTDTGIPLLQDNTTGNGFASFLLGVVSSASIETKRVVSDQWKYYGFYVQDDWRATKRLTISYGIRYEFTPPTHEGRFPDGYSNFNPNLPNPAANGRLGAYEYAGTGPGRTGSRSLYDSWPYGIGPRLGLAYSLNDKTVIRASAGRSFGSLKNTGGSSHFHGYIQSKSFDRQGVANAFQLDDGVPYWEKPPFLVPEFNVNSSVNFWQRYDAGRLPEYYSLSLNIQRQLPKNMILEVGYNSTLGHHLVTNTVNVNQLDPRVFFGLANRLGFDNAYSLMGKRIDSPEAAAAGIVKPYANFPSGSSVLQSLRPYPQYTGISTAGDGGDHSGNSTYHAVVVKWEKRYSSGLTFLNSYVFSKFFTDAETANASSSGSMDHYNRVLEKALSRNDLTHNLKFSFSYELPFGKGKKFLSHGVASAIAGGWRIAGINTYVSGAPYSISPGYSLPGVGNRLTVNDYSGWRGNTAGDKFDPFKDSWWNVSAFDKTPRDVVSSSVKGGVLKTGFGNATVRNPKERGPWGLNESVSLARDFRFTERVHVNIRAEAFNLLNRTRWGGPDSSVTSNNFGLVRSLGNDPRQMQFGAKLQF